MPTLFNGCGFGPPPPLTVASTWTWIGHPVSGLYILTRAHFTLAFASAPYLKYLTSPAYTARRTVLQKVRGHTLNSASTACRHSVSGSLSLPSRGAFHLSFTVLYAICGPKPHGARTMVWALPRSLAATYGIILIFSSSGYLDVSVHRVPSVYLLIQYTVTGIASRVSPFRYLRIPACLRLPVAFRSLSRLSSALSAKASTLRPFLLNLRSAASELLSSAAWFSRCIPLHGDS